MKRALLYYYEENEQKKEKAEFEAAEISRLKYDNQMLKKEREKAKKEMKNLQSKFLSYRKMHHASCEKKTQIIKELKKKIKEESFSRPQEASSNEVFSITSKKKRKK